MTLKYNQTSSQNESAQTERITSSLVWEILPFKIKFKILTHLSSIFIKIFCSKSTFLTDFMSNFQMRLKNLTNYLLEEETTLALLKELWEEDSGGNSSIKYLLKSTSFGLNLGSMNLSNLKRKENNNNSDICLIQNITIKTLQMVVTNSQWANF